LLLIGSEDAATDLLLERLARDHIKHLWIVYTDYNGRSQAKSVPSGRFGHAVPGGITFARANLDFNVLDHMVESAIFSADTGDFFAVPDPDTYAHVPYVADTARVMAWMRDAERQPWDGCPRTILARQVEAFAEQGIRVEAAFEPEAYLFRRSPDGSIEPSDRTGMFTLDGLDTHADLLHQFSETLDAMGVVVEQVAPEYGPGQVEINIHHALPLKAADDLVVVKDTLRSLARTAGLIASFMPKPFSEIAGCGLHLHLSLWSAENGECIIEDNKGQDGISKIGRGFLAGILNHAPALTGIGSPTVNSYKRLQPGSWAPAHAAYGIGNRATFVRIPGSARRRFEVRSGDNTSSPYIYLAAVLAAGLEGINAKADPGPPAEGDLGSLTAEESKALGITMLPRSAEEALGAVEADPLISTALGPVIFPEWLKVKWSEFAAFSLDVSEWERNAYLEA
jgi:glutamine synthetase